MKQKRKKVMRKLNTQLFFIRTLIFLFISMIFFSCNKVDPPQTEVKQNKEEVLPENNITADQVMGKFDPTTHDDFVRIDEKYADRSGMFLHKETYDAFERMSVAAAADGVDLVIRSATRNFDRQKQIWEGKWTGKRLVENGENLAQSTPDPTERAKKILLWSSMPGTSRHHWGTDIDLNSFDNSYFESGQGKKIYDWLVNHGDEYGFCQPYSEKGEQRPDGYNEERWHWSYTPLANQYLDRARTALKNEDITGFQGSETAIDIEVKEKYIFGISHSCGRDR